MAKTGLLQDLSPSDSKSQAGDDSVSPKPSQGQPVVSFIAEAGGECFTNRWFLVGHVPEVVVSLC